MTNHRLAIGGLLLALFILPACSGADGSAPAPAESQPPKRVVRIETMVVEPSSFEDVIELTGSVEAQNDATISAQTSGTLVYRRPLGAYVPRGARIAQIDSTLTHAAYLQAAAQKDAAKALYELALDSYNRQEPLYQDSIISAAEFEATRAQMHQTQAQFRQAEAATIQLREQLDLTRITAPFSGRVESYGAEVGEQVAPGSPVVRIVNTAQVKLRAGVPERYANDIRSGTRVRVHFDTYGTDTYEGTVSFAGSAINPMNRTFPIEINVDNTEGTLKPEMVARVEVTRAELDGVLVIPQNAVLLDEAGRSVFVVSRDGLQPTATQRDVTIGATYGGMVVITEGIQSQDEVIVLGQSNLSEGDAVEIVQQVTTESAGE